MTEEEVRAVAGEYEKLRALATRVALDVYEIRFVGPPAWNVPSPQGLRQNATSDYYTTKVDLSGGGDVPFGEEIEVSFEDPSDFEYNQCVHFPASYLWDPVALEQERARVVEERRLKEEEAARKKAMAEAHAAMKREIRDLEEFQRLRKKYGV